MPTDTTAPLSDKRQCRNCGATFALWRDTQVHCPPCADLARREKLPHQIARRNERIRLWAWNQRRARGDKLFRGDERTCEFPGCGKVFIARGIAHKICDECQPAHRFEIHRKQEAKRVRPGRVKVGTAIVCPTCKQEFTKAGANSAYCSADCKLKRWTNDPRYVIHRRMSANMKSSLDPKKTGRRKKGGRSWESLVDYTLEDLMRHLERQFTGRMSWANRGKWHIDHIQPLVSFNFASAEDPEFKAAWALTNLRPLWKRPNLMKSGKRTLLL